MTLCEKIGHWAAGLHLEEIPPTVIERARLQTANLLAAARAGADAAAPFAAVAPDGPAGEVYRDAAASIAHDWDDYLFMGHTGHSAVWAARAFSDDPDRALLAQIAANEVAGRLGAALFLGPHNGQFWSSIHCAGGAMGAGVGLGLDAERLAHALAIALYQPPYGVWPGFMGPGSKLLTAAEPAAQGARAALLAAEGVEGALDVIEHPRGVLTHFSFVPRPQMLGALGRVWLTDTLAFKPVPGCAYLQSVVDAALDAEVSAGDVAAVDVEAGYLTCAMEEVGRGRARGSSPAPPSSRRSHSPALPFAVRGSLTPVRVNFSTALSVAVTLVAGRLTHEELDPAWLSANELELRDLAGRIGVHHDWELTAATLRGAIDAGATLRDVSLGGWLRVARRARELNMDEAGLGWARLRALLGDPRARRSLGGTVREAIRRGSEGGLADLDTARLRMTFPCRLRIRLRSGRTLEIEGEEPGSCGSPVSEQRAVVEEKCRVAGVEEPVRG